MEHKRKLGEVLVACQYISSQELEFLLTFKPAGMRMGELFGLRWTDVDFDMARIHVRRSYRTTPKSGKGRTVMTALENFTPLIGGIPITVDGQIVGGVGVSGAARADQDEELAIAGTKAFETSSSSMTGDSPAVSYWEKSKVDEAFSKGSVLFDGSDGRNYMVHASRREKPGQAEIHTKDADVIYVLQGSATFVTGGEAVDAKNTAPDELRGSSIRNGETREIAKGDVVIVPHGVPHQFLTVTDPFLYYVVKVR